LGNFNSQIKGYPATARFKPLPWGAAAASSGNAANGIAARWVSKIVNQYQ